MKYSCVLLLVTLAFIGANKIKNDSKSEKGEQKCPKGYIYTGIQGSVRYPIARWKNMSVHQCAKKCDEEIHCKSFEYEAGSKECKISHSLYPNQRNYRQFYFCQKEEAHKEALIESKKPLKTIEAKKNLTKDLAEGTDAPIADNGSIPSALSKKVEDLKTTSVKSGL